MLFNAKNYTFAMLFFLMPLLVSAQSGVPPQRELVFVNWPEYVDPEVITSFEKSRNVKVRFNYFQSDDERDRIVLDVNGRAGDVVLLNGLTIKTYVGRGWLAPLDESKMPNLRHIETKWRDAFEDSHAYAAPYFWGTIGIAYRKDLVPEKITSWKQFFNPPPSIGKRIVMFDSTREVVGMALKASGYSINSESVNEIREAGKLLMQQKPFVKGYTYFSNNERSTLVSGEDVMGLAFNGDALRLKQFQPNIEYVLPEEGQLLWADYLAVMAASDQKELAYDFINYLNEPENAAKLALFSNYASPNLAAMDLLPEEFLANTIIYPDQATLEKSEVARKLSIKAGKEFARIMAKLTRD